MQGGPNCVIQEYLDDTWTALKSFYHPSNNGRWTVSAEWHVISWFTVKWRHLNVCRANYCASWQPCVASSCVASTRSATSLAIGTVSWWRHTSWRTVRSRRSSRASSPSCCLQCSARTDRKTQKLRFNISHLSDLSSSSLRFLIGSSLTRIYCRMLCVQHLYVCVHVLGRTQRFRTWRSRIAWLRVCTASSQQCDQWCETRVATQKVANTSFPSSTCAYPESTPMTPRKPW